VSKYLPIIYLAKHGETEWSITEQHAVLADLSLTENGDRLARRRGTQSAEIRPTSVGS
jgi:probable phosphoglycerate mutase